MDEYLYSGVENEPISTQSRHNAINTGQNILLFTNPRQLEVVGPELMLQRLERTPTR